MIENYNYILENIENFSFKDLNNTYKKENGLSLWKLYIKFQIF